MRLRLTWKMGRRPASPFRLRTGGLGFGQLPVRLHDPFRTPLRVAGAQHVHAGLGVARRMLAVGLDPDRGGQLRCAPFAAAALDGNVILPRHLPVAFLEPCLEYLRSFGLFGLWQLWQSSGPGGRVHFMIAEKSSDVKVQRVSRLAESKTAVLYFT